VPVVDIKEGTVKGKPVIYYVSKSESCYGSIETGPTHIKQKLQPEREQPKHKQPKRKQPNELNNNIANIVVGVFNQQLVKNASKSIIY
jgi:hypothetical protein